MMHLDQYLRLNQAFGDPLLFHLTDRGFYSEVNNLLSAILFGLLYRRRLIVDQSRFEGQAWERLFTSSLPERGHNDAISPEWIVEGTASPNFWTIQAEIRKLQRRLLPVALPTGQWGKPRTFLRGLAKIFTAPRQTIAAPNGLGPEYAAFHIRRGDKTDRYLGYEGKFIVEGELTPVETYLALLRQKAPGTRSVFVMTDDHSIVDELRAVASDLKFYSFSASSERGYRQNDFSAKPAADKERRLKRLLAEVEIVSRSNLFLGGFKSNVARYVALTHQSPALCFSIDDAKKWMPG